jgi:hypothetical protein
MAQPQGKLIVILAHRLTQIRSYINADPVLIQSSDIKKQSATGRCSTVCITPQFSKSDFDCCLPVADAYATLAQASIFLPLACENSPTKLSLQAWLLLVERSPAPQLHEWYCC